jgi:hypothetical protein
MGIRLFLQTPVGVRTGLFVSDGRVGDRIDWALGMWQVHGVESYCGAPETVSWFNRPSKSHVIRFGKGNRRGSGSQGNRLRISKLSSIPAHDRTQEPSIRRRTNIVSIGIVCIPDRGTGVEAVASSVSRFAQWRPTATCFSWTSTPSLTQTSLT